MHRGWPLRSSAVGALRKSLAAALRPPPALSYSQWAEQFFRLSGATAQPGRFRPWKFQRGILDAIGDPTIERVSVIKAARTGYTTSLTAALGATAVNDPSPIILLMPTDDDARGIIVDEIDPAFRDSPALRDIMKIGRFDGRNTLTNRTMLGGGSLKVISARAPRNLRRHTAKVLFCDEVDGMEVTSEGDPIKLAEKRTTSYADRKIVAGSTPTDEATSIIAKRYEASDKRVFGVPCPHCSQRFELLWEHIDRSDKDNVVAVCPANGCIIEERDKPLMVAEGEWRATAPEVKGHAGFRMSALVSLFANASWARLAEEYESALKSGPGDLQVFYNTVLGQVWSTAVGYVDDTQLIARVEKFGLAFDVEASRWRQDIPLEVLYITVGCDVQVDRLEITFIGHSEDGQRWFLGHEIIRGHYKHETTWAEFDAMLMTVWKHPLGGDIGVEAACVDSGDGNITQQVYDFCGPRFGRKIVAIKGQQGPKPVLKASTGRRKRAKGATLFIVGTDQVKTDIITAMSLDRGRPSALRFSDGLEPEWFRQFTSERREVKYKRGRAVIEFVPLPNRRAEAIDCAVYGIAARHLCRFDFDRRRMDLSKKPIPRPSLRDRVAGLHN